MATPVTDVTAAIARARPARTARPAARGAVVRRVSGYLVLLGLGWIVPILKLTTGEPPREQLKELWQQLGVPLAAIALFVVVWAQLAARVDTSLGGIPGPTDVWTEAKALLAEHKAERVRRGEF